MHLDHDEEDYNLSLAKFESMLKTNKVLFFDSEEFEEIILHYLDMGKANLAKKAQLGRESLYKTLSENGNPKWHTLVSLIISLGLNLRLS